MDKFNFKRIVLALGIVVAFLMQADVADAFQGKLLYEPGDTIQVKWHNDWFDAEVTEILPGSRALRAKFIDDRKRERTWMFPSSQIRESESGSVTSFGNKSGSDDEDEGSKDKNESGSAQKFREWNSADGKFSVEAQFVSFDGEKVELLKRDDRTIKVPLTTFGKNDVAHVNQIVADQKAKQTKDPFKAENPFESDDPFNVAPKKRPESSATQSTEPANSKPKTTEPDPFNIKKDPRKPRVSHPPFHKPELKDESKFDEKTTFGGVDVFDSTPRNSKSNSQSSKPKKKSSLELAAELESANDPNFPKVKIKSTGGGLSYFIRIGIFLTSLLFGTLSVAWGVMNRSKYK